MKLFIIDLVEWFLNYVVAYIPFWIVRKCFYQIAGMKIGKKSRILMGLYVRKPWKIQIGECSVINEKCMLDGRGGLKIGNNVAISIYTKILTATHLTNSNNFLYIEKAVEIENNVWIGINAVILPGVVLYDNSVLAAGSVMIQNKCEKKNSMIYSGVPAVSIGTRNNTPEYEMWKFKPFFK